MSDSIKTTFPTFDMIKQALCYLNALGTAAETHGLLCALFATGAMLRKDAWVNSILAKFIHKDNVSAQDAQRALANLYDATSESFSHDDVILSILLPDNQVEIEMRIEALTEWCQGFLSGLNLFGINIQNHPVAAINEALQDMIAISAMKYDEEQTGESEAENHFVELVTYCRMIVMMIHTDTKDKTDSTESVASAKRAESMESVAGVPAGEHIE